ncbi:MAG: aminotransferase, partial [Pseudomonadota bacterium]
LLLPASIYQSELGSTPSDRFRIGLGRRGLSEGLDVMTAHIATIM